MIFLMCCWILIARILLRILDGKKLLTNARSLEGLEKGTYIINGEKRIIE